VDTHALYNVNNYRNVNGNQYEYKDCNATAITDAISIPDRRVSGQHA
jgi:hypothetical protein